MKISNQFKKFDRKYLFLEYNLTNFLLTQQKLNLNVTHQTGIKVRSVMFSVDSTNQNIRISKKNANLKSLSSYLQFVESTIEKDFILLQHMWTFFKIYSKPKLLKLFPNRRSFFCYWIFPFVGFITISNFNSGIQKHFLLIESKIEALPPKGLVENNFSLNWDKIEYLNYKKLFFQNNSSNRKIGHSLSPINNNTLPILNNHTETFLVKSNKITNFDRTQTQDVINNCTVYLNKIAKSIYTSKTSLDLLNITHPNNNHFITKTGHYTFKVNNLTETLLGNHFNYNSILESYWYPLNLLRINKTGTFKNLNTKIGNLFFQNYYKSDYKPNIIKKWQLYQDFPHKLLPVNSNQILLTSFNRMKSINKNVEEHSQKFNIFSDHKTVTFNFQDLINVNFKETNVISNVAKQFKNTLNLAETTHPIFFYEKTYILLNNLIEKFDLDFSIDLKSENLQNLLSKQRLSKSTIERESDYKLTNTNKLDSNFLHYLRKLLISSKFFEKPHNSVCLEKIQPSLLKKYNQNFQAVDFGYLREGKKVNRELNNLTNREMFFNKIDIKPRKKVNFSYYLITKKNLHSILLKKFFLNFPIRKTVKNLPGGDIQSVSKIIDIYKIQKKILKHETNELSNVKILLNNSNLVTCLLSGSKPKLKKIFLLSKLNLKVNKILKLMLDQSFYSPKQVSDLADFIRGKELKFSSLKSKRLLKIFLSDNDNNKPKNTFTNFNKKPNNLLLTLVSTSQNYSNQDQLFDVEFQDDKINNSTFPLKRNSIKNLNQLKIIRPKHDAIYFSYEPVFLEKAILTKNITTKLTNSNSFNNKLLNSFENLTYGHKKMKFLVNNLDINQNLFKTIRLEKIIKYNRNYFFVKTNQPQKIVCNSVLNSDILSFKSKKLKNDIIWSKLKINNLNYFAKQIFNTTGIKAEFDVNKTQKNMMTKFPNQKYFYKFDNTIGSYFPTREGSFFRNQTKQSYYVNTINKNTFKNVAFNFYSKKLFDSHQTDFLKLNPAKSNFNSLVKKIGANEIERNNSENLLNLKVTKIKKKLENFERFQIPRQFSHYIQNLSNQLKRTLINSKLYVIKMSNKKKLSLKNIFKRNFYININKNKTLSFKLNKVKYQLRKKNDTHEKFIKFGSKLTPMKIKPAIEKIFRNYLSSKYNKRGNSSLKSQAKNFHFNKDSFFTLNNQQELSFLKKESNFCDFKIYNKTLNLKVQKEFSQHNKNSKKIIPTGSNSYSENKTLFKLTKHNNFFVPSLTNQKQKNRNGSVPIITPSTSNTPKFYYSLQSPFKIMKKIGFIFFRNDIKNLSDSLVSTNLNIHFKKLKINFRNSAFVFQSEGNSDHTSRQGKEASKHLVNLEVYKKLYLTKTHKKQSLVKRLEKGKNLQKKRRQKKQARLTGRRKKRKRFFPRPIWLRFLLYKKFLKFRHTSNLNSINMKLDTKKLIINSKLAKILKFIVNKNESLHTSILVKPNPLALLKPVRKLTNKSIRQTIYRSNKQNWGNIFFDIPQLEKITLKKFFLLESLPIFSEIQFYEISTNLLQDFKKTMWKSYWLRTNFPNYIKTIQNYLDQIKISISDTSILINLKHFLFEIWDLNFQENSFKFFSANFDGKTELALTKIDQKQISPVNVLDYKSKFQNYNALELPKTKKRLSSKFIRNTNLNYSPLWYLNIRQNFSSFSTLPSGYMYLGTSNLIQFNSSLYDRIQYIIKNIKSNLNVDGHSQLRAFNPKRSYRANLISDNFIQNLLKEWWIRFENSLNSSFSRINIPQEIYLNQAKFRILWGLNKTNVWSFKKHSENSLAWTRSKIRDQNKSNKTNKSIQNFFNRIKYITKNKSTRRQKLIHKIFLDKFQHANEKIKQLGLLIIDKDSLKMEFKSHKTKNYRLLSTSILQDISMNNKIQINNQISNLILKESLNSYFKTHPKHYLKFWWSESKFTNYFLIQTDFSFKNDFFLSMLDKSNEINTSNKNNNLFLIGNPKYDFLMISSCLILLHVCLLFTLLNIGQIRTFLKFQLLCIYKLTNIYLTIIYWSFKNLKQLKTTLYLYSNISSDLLKNLLLTKQSFLLLTDKQSYKNSYLDFTTPNSKLWKFNKTDHHLYVQGSDFDFPSSEMPKYELDKGKVELSKNRNWITSIKYNSTKTPNIVLYSHGQYSIAQDFENSILKSLSFNNKLFHDHNLKFNIKNKADTFNDRDYLNLSALLQQENSSSLGDLKNEVKLIEQSNSYEQVLERIINKRNKSDFLNIFMLKNKKNEVNNKLNLKQIKPLKKNSILKKNHFSKFIFQNISYSTNLLCYNILKSTLGFKQTLSLIPSRSVQIVAFGSTNLKVLPNQYQSLASLVVNKYIISSFYLSILFFVSILIKISNKSLIGLYIILFKSIDLIEGIMLIIYKSLEKPAELMIDFISEFFLIEWSSDIVSFIPETFDIYTLTFSQKLSRNFRIFGFTSFFSQRRFLCFIDSLLEGITKPDIDLIIRQKKGIIFWDIWAEILVQAAEIYSINLSSLFNIKEEQDLFLEKLINEKKWNWSTDVLDKMSPLMQLLQNSKPSGFSNNSSLFCTSEQIWRRWSVNPYYTYQAKDTDLFVENHPPKSFSHFKLMKYYPPVFEPVGNLVCQIYAGQFVKSISKNLLLVGSRGTNKTLLIQALAGETELKIMIDNAKRYALTSKGIAIGMKLLKDVFDALALQAPCLFIIEDIHIIGERRPMLISDDENIKAMENSFGVDQEEIHEKNQVIYQLSRHSIVHYKKPYKGDFSLLIPTNHFALDLFLGSSPPKTRVIAQVPENPLPIKSIEQEIASQNDSDNSPDKSASKYLKFLTQLQLPKKEIFSPPSTSPFTILLLKEQKKIKPKKIVSEMPWGGLSADQLIQLPKASYSVRVKVALLADIAIRNLSVKLDRITDLLIIIDSVRSHRGFVVIGTTHIPSILDPALRRPGRFDETLTIPALPNLWSRWEILKSSVSDFSSTLDLMDLAELFNTLNDTELSTIIAKTKLFLLTKQSFLNKNVNTQLPNQLLQSNQIKNELLHDKKLELILFKINQSNKLSLLNSFSNVLKFGSYPTIIDPFQMKQNRKTATVLNFQKNKNLNHLITETNFINSTFNKNINSGSFSMPSILDSSQTEPKLISLVSSLKSFNPALSIFKTSTNCLAISYFQISKWFISSQLVKDRSSYTSLLWSTISKNSMNSSDSLFSSDIFNSLGSHTEKNSTFAIYSSTVELKNQLVELFAGKIGELFAFYDIKSMSQLLKENSNEFNGNLRDSLSHKRATYDTTNYQEFWNDFQSINTWKYSSVINLYGIDETWGRASDLIFSIIYKRCLYNKTVLINRLFNLHNIKSLRQPPSPPVSTSFMAAKRYENYKRVEFDLQNRLTFSVHEKIQKHQQQRYIKTLYNRPLQKYFHSELEIHTKNSKSSNSAVTTFENSFREMSLIDINQKLQSQNKSSRLSSSDFFFNKRINIRHRFYLINQWWNTQLAEHNAETTFLSEIDWRYMFMDGIGDLWMDFPDTDQHYNPRTRQWVVTSGYWSYWYNFEKLITQEIYYQFLMESFYKAYNVLETSRELLDLTCYEFLTSSLLKEIDFINYLKRFYK